MAKNLTVEGVNNNINRLTKLMRTFTAQVEALNKYRSKGQQKITVQHVNVENGGQAIVGDVTQGGVMAKWKGPPHEEMPRCGAKTRPGHPCGHYAMKNGRCRYHGGKSTGANNPRVKHGYYTKKALAERMWLSDLLKEVDQVISGITGQAGI